MSEIELELPDSEMLWLLMEAHKQDKTFNMYIKDLIVDHIDNMYVDAAEKLAIEVEHHLYCDPEVEGSFENELMDALDEYWKHYNLRFGDSGHRKDYGAYIDAQKS